jgi:hypothetical protein
MPRPLQSQAGGEALSSCEAADATVEEGGSDQVVGSQNHHKLAESL